MQEGISFYLQMFLKETSFKKNQFHFLFLIKTFPFFTEMDSITGKPVPGIKSCFYFQIISVYWQKLLSHCLMELKL